MQLDEPELFPSPSKFSTSAFSWRRTRASRKNGSRRATSLRDRSRPGYHGTRAGAVCGASCRSSRASRAAAESIARRRRSAGAATHVCSVSVTSTPTTSAATRRTGCGGSTELPRALSRAPERAGVAGAGVTGRNPCRGAASATAPMFRPPRWRRSGPLPLPTLGLILGSLTTRRGSPRSSAGDLGLPASALGSMPKSQTIQVPSSAPRRGCLGKPACARRPSCQSSECGYAGLCSAAGRSSGVWSPLSSRRPARGRGHPAARVRRRSRGGDAHQQPQPPRGRALGPA